MKRFLGFCTCLALALGLFAAPASANQWGLSGDLLVAVSAAHTWDNYSTLCHQIDDLALMRSRDHNALMLLIGSEGTLYVYSKAVYQPGDGRDGEVALRKTEGGFTQSYGSAEWYTFALEDNAYVLREAAVGSFHVAPATDSDNLWNSHRYVASDGTDEAELRLYITLSDFNISLFPHSVAEVRHLNLMRAALASGGNCLGWVEYPERPGSQLYSGAGTGTEPVYSSPFGDSAWRAADGKAAVGLKGELWSLCQLHNADGDAYVCIRYDINDHVQRIGYIRASALGISKSDTFSANDNFLAVDVQALQDTYLTDDPDVSQTPLFAVPKGTLFTCLGIYGDDYAYVAAEVRGGQFVGGGAIVWGFVPLKALGFFQDDFHNAVQTDVMNAVAGDWVFCAGGNMAEDTLTLNADGTYTGRYYDTETNDLLLETHGTWYVTKNNPFWNLYWNDPPYELTLINANGTANVKGLALAEDGFSLTDHEGSGGYTRPDSVLFTTDD